MSLVRHCRPISWCVFFFQAEDGIRDLTVTGVQTCALPISHVHIPRVHAGMPRGEQHIVEGEGDGGTEGSHGESYGERSEEHTSELQSQSNLVCRLLLEKKNITTKPVRVLVSPWCRVMRYSD